MTKDFHLKYIKNSYNSMINILIWTEGLRTFYKTGRSGAGGRTTLTPVCTCRIKSSSDWPSTVWTRWFTGRTSASPPSGGPVCVAGSRPPSFDKVGTGGRSSFWFRFQQPKRLFGESGGPSACCSQDMETSEGWVLCLKHCPPSRSGVLRGLTTESGCSAGTCCWSKGSETKIG